MERRGKTECIYGHNMEKYNPRKFCEVATCRHLQPQRQFHGSIKTTDSTEQETQSQNQLQLYV